MLRAMMGAILLSGAIPCFACGGTAVQDDEEARLETLRKRLQDPASVWPMFQEYLREGEYSKAHGLLAPSTKRGLDYPPFYIIFASYEAPRHMIATTQAHQVDPAGRLKLCNKEFGFSRDVKLAKWGLGGKWIWTLEFTPDDIEFFKGRPMIWYRHQVKRADGWHFAYPPDWTYAPLWRHCVCGK